MKTPTLTTSQRNTILGPSKTVKAPDYTGPFPVAPGQKSLLIAALRHYAASHESLAADGFEVARHRATQARTLAHCLTMATTVNFS